MKVRIDIIDTVSSTENNRYRAIIQVCHNPKPPADKKIIYTSLKEIKERKISCTERRNLIKKLKKKAQKWARNQKIKYVANLDPESFYS